MANRSLTAPYFVNPFTNLNPKSFLDVQADLYICMDHSQGSLRTFFKGFEQHSANKHTTLSLMLVNCRFRGF